MTPQRITIYGGEYDGISVSPSVAMRLCGAGLINVPASGRAFVSAAGRKAKVEDWQEAIKYANSCVELEGGE